MSADLLPCPFCGTKPVMSKKSLDERLGYANQVEIRCGSCGADKKAQGDISKPGYADNSTTEKRAIEAWNMRPAIAPPVAAGSVDMVEFNDYLADYVTSRVLHKPDTMERRDRLMNRINAWGAQQREAGKAEQTELLKECMIRGQAEFNLKWTEHKGCAEKAEAELDSLKESLRLVNVDHGLWMARTHEAEDARDDALARVKELEAQLARPRAPLSPEMQQAIAAARAEGQTIAATLDGLVFLNGGTGPGEGELDCPTCGGSGHAGDVVAGGAA